MHLGGAAVVVCYRFLQYVSPQDKKYISKCCERCKNSSNFQLSGLSQVEKEIQIANPLQFLWNVTLWKEFIHKFK